MRKVIDDEEEKEPRKLRVLAIFRVLYSPLKAFREIARAPDVKGPFFILLLTLLASVGAQYVNSSKTLLETAEGSTVYTPLTATSFFGERLLTALTDTLFRFFLNWLVYGATFLLFLKLFRAKEGPWHQVFTVIGYSFIVATFFVFVNAIIVSTFPVVHLKFGVWNGVLEGNQERIDEMILTYEETLGSLLAYQVMPYFSIIIAAWIAALDAIGVHFLREVSWNKALIISTIVSVLSLFLLGPLIFYF